MLDSPSFHSNSDARVLMLSQRNLYDHVSRSGGYEFEDVICKSDAVDVFTPCNSYELSSHVFRAIKYLTRSSQLANILKPDPNPIVLDRDYDLFFVLCASAWDLLSVRSIKNWRKRCRKAVCYIDEIWRKDIHLWKPILELLKDFDHVFLTYNGSVQEVAEIIQRPCTYLPLAVDAIEFSPYPGSPERSIDVYNMGRRSPITHHALLRLSEAEGSFYHYDTFKSFSVINPREHRLLLANLIKRSRYFIVNKAKVDQPNQIGVQQEIGNRFFEGAAGGAVLLGEPVETDSFKAFFDWQDVVISIPYDCPNIAEVIAELDAQPDRLATISRDNAVNSLLRHDWVYRWESILKAVGIEPIAEMQLRKAQLRCLAEQASIEFVASLN